MTEKKVTAREILEAVEGLPERLKTALKDYLKPKEPELKRITPEEWREGVTKHLLECPDCYADIFNRVYRPSEYECINCGLPIRDLEVFDVCPECRSERARKRGK